MQSARLFIIGLALAAGATARADTVTVAALQARQEAGAKITVIDVRVPSVFAQGHIPGAINVPASLCAVQSMPPVGDVIVYGDGLIGDPVDGAAASLAAKPGLKVDVLEGGYAAWKTAGNLTTHGAGLSHEDLNYVSYARLKAANLGNAVLLDLRKPVNAKSRPLTDLASEFPGAHLAKSRAEAMVRPKSGPSQLVVLIDNGDGSSEAEARRLKAGGLHNYVILAGGELILSRKGQAGLDRSSSISGVNAKISAQPLK